MIRTLTEEEKQEEARILAMNARAKMNKFLASKEKELEEIRKNPYCPFTCKEGYDLAVEAGWPNDMMWLQNMVDLIEEKKTGEKPIKRKPIKPEDWIEFK